MDPTECGTFAGAIRCPASPSCRLTCAPIDHLKADGDWRCENGHVVAASSAAGVEEAVREAWVRLAWARGAGENEPEHGGADAVAVATVEDPQECEDFLRDVCEPALGAKHHLTMKVSKHTMAAPADAVVVISFPFPPFAQCGLRAKGAK